MALWPSPLLFSAAHAPPKPTHQHSLPEPLPCLLLLLLLLICCCLLLLRPAAAGLLLSLQFEADQQKLNELQPADPTHTGKGSGQVAKLLDQLGEVTSSATAGLASSHSGAGDPSTLNPKP